MQRKLGESVFPSNREIGYEIGDQLAREAAIALAERFDAPTLILLADAMAFLNRVGGQVYIGTIRRKVDGAGNLVTDDDPGEYKTFGMALHYESRDAAVKLAKPPEEILGVPVTESSEATEVTIEEPEVTAAEAGPVEDELDLSFEEPGPGVFEEPTPEPVAGD